MTRHINRHFPLSLLIIATLLCAIIFGYTIQHAAPNSILPSNVFAWGNAANGQLGDGSGGAGTGARSTPQGVEDLADPSNYLTGAINLAAGGNHSLALISDGTISSWGSNSAGQLGVAKTEAAPQQNRPVKVLDGNNNPFNNVAAISAGAIHSMAVKTDRTVWTWGSNNSGQLGTEVDNDDSSHPIPKQVKVDPRRSNVEPSGFLTGVTSVDGGAFFSLALKADGTVWSWGQNNYNALGSSLFGPRTQVSNSQRAVPVDLLTEVTAIAAGTNHSLARRANGTVWAWGRNVEGELGNGTQGGDVQNGQLTPVPVNISNVRLIAAGAFHNLALKEDGTLWAWGFNGQGQLGNGGADNRANQLNPVQINLTGVVAIAAGVSHSLALKADGTVWAWGANNLFQLGVNSITESLVPMQVGGINGGVLIDAGDSHNIVLKPDNITGRVVFCNNGNASEKIAINVSGSRSGTTITNSRGYYAVGIVERGGNYVLSPANQSTPSTPVSVPVTNLTGNQLANFCIGDPPVSISGQIKDGNLQPLSGLTVTLSSGQTQVSVQTDTSGNYIFNDLRQGTVYMVSPSATNYSFDPQSRPFSPLTQTVTNADFVGSLNEFSDPTQQLQDIVWAWGRNGSGPGQLGYTTATDSTPIPAPVSSLVGITTVDGGGFHSLGRRPDGRVLAWGSNQNGQLGDGTLAQSTTPVFVSSLTGTTKIVTGFAHSMALKADQTVSAWGNNDSGKLGDGSEINRAAPVTVTTRTGTLTDVIDIAAGGVHSLALKSNGTVWSWGRNDYNALGSSLIGVRSFESQSQRAVPVDALTDVTAIAAGGNHSLALRANGTVWAWGRNAEGELGNGTRLGTAGNVTQGQLTPVQVSNLSGVTAIAAGAIHSLSLVNGSVWAWGSNQYGQLGNATIPTGESNGSSVPVQVNNLSNVTAIAADGFYSLALKSDGTIWAWGRNDRGQLGDSTTTDRNTPVQVMGLTGVKSIGAGYEHALATVETRRISGRITDASGAGVNDVTVTLGGSPTTITHTNQNGEYAFVNLALHGDYVVTPSSTSLVFDPPSKTFMNLSGNQVADFRASPQQSSETVLSLNSDSLTAGTLSQNRPVLDKRVQAVLQNDRLVITPLRGVANEHFNGYVSTKAISFVNKGVSVRVEQAASDNSETIFSVGSDKDHWYRLVITDVANTGAVGSAKGIFSAQSGDKMLVAQSKNGVGSAPVTHGMVPFNPDTKPLMNISATGTPDSPTVTFSSSSNGTTTVLASVPSTPGPAGNASVVELSAGTKGPATVPGTAIFSGLAVSAVTPTFQFSAANYPVNEGDGRTVITVTRSGDTSGADSVEYRTADADTFTFNCADTVNNRVGAFARCDYATIVGTLNFAAGETTKTITVPIINDAHVEETETFQVVLSNPNRAGATLGTPSTTTVMITDNDTAGAANPNPITTTPFFVRQQYLDFLSREPEAGEPWTKVLTDCRDVNNPFDVLLDCDRINVSFSFFGAPEFQLKGFYVFLFYKVGLNRLPLYTEIVPDMSAVTGTIPADTFARRTQLANDFVQRAEFTNLFPASMTNQVFVTTLLGRYQLTSVTTPDPQQPEGTVKVTLTSAQLVAQLTAQTLTRAQVLRAIVQSDEVIAREFDNTFVAMQYYGYLRRTPDQGGYDSNVGALKSPRLINSPTRFREIVNAFVNSVEYRLRFGSN